MGLFFLVLVLFFLVLVFLGSFFDCDSFVIVYDLSVTGFAAQEASTHRRKMWFTLLQRHASLPYDALCIIWAFSRRHSANSFFGEVEMIPTMRQHSITWLGRTRTGKSFGSKSVLFMQSKFEIDDADRSDLVPSIVTAKNLDFFKAEPLTRFKPGVFDDGMLQKMDSSFLKAFLNPSVACIPYIKLWFSYIQHYIS